MDKLASLEKHDERAAIALAAQMSMLARQTLDEIRGIDAGFDVPSLAYLGRMATKAQMGEAILGAPLPDLMAGLPPSQLDQDFRGPLRAELKGVWDNEPDNGMEEASALQTCGHLVGVPFQFWWRAWMG